MEIVEIRLDTDLEADFSYNYFTSGFIKLRVLKLKTLPFRHFIQMFQKVKFSNRHFSSFQAIGPLIDKLKTEISYFHLIDSIKYHMFYIFK